MTTCFLSSFELLFEPITPKTLNPSPSVPDPVIVQAYFVLISNVGSTPISLTLTFKVASELPLVGKSITIFDTANKFPPGSSIPFPSSNIVKLPALPPGQTGLFLLQPDIVSLLKPLSGDITKATFASRGYVEVSATDCQALITPQTRGTFLTQTSVSPVDLNVIAQEAYSLPTPQSNLFTFST